MSLQEIDPRYPVGKFHAPATITPDDRDDAIATLAELPEQLRNAVEGLSSAQLNTPYREGGWTVRQVVHHIADSHMNALIRVTAGADGGLADDQAVRRGGVGDSCMMRRLRWSGRWNWWRACMRDG